MQRAVLIAGGLIVAALGGWYAVWAGGAGQLRSAIEAERAQLAAQGTTVEGEIPSVGGFPFSYRLDFGPIAAVEAGSGQRLELPRLTAEAALFDPDTVTFRLPETARLIVPLPPETGVPSPATVDLESEGLIARLSGLAAAERRLTLEGPLLSLILVTPDKSVGIEIILSGIESTTVLPPSPTLGELVGSGTVSRIDYVATITTPEKSVVEVLGLYEKLQATTRTNLRTSADATAFLEGQGPGIISGAFSTGAYSTTVKVTGAPSGGDGTFALSGGSATGVLELDGEGLDLSLLSRANVYDVTAPDAASPVEGGVAIDSVELIYSAPTRPAADAQPFKLRFAMLDAIPDAALWSKIDPDQHLARDPADAVLDMSGTVRLLKSTAAIAAGEALPVEIETLRLDGLKVAALGAGVSASGAVKMLEAGAAAVGEFEVRMTGILPAVEALAAAGLIDPALIQTATAMSQVYARPGEAPGELLSTVVVAPEGVTVNGVPVR